MLSYHHFCWNKGEPKSSFCLPPLIFFSESSSSHNMFILKKCISSESIASSVQGMYHVVSNALSYCHRIAYSFLCESGLSVISFCYNCMPGVERLQTNQGFAVPMNEWMNEWILKFHILQIWNIQYFLFLAKTSTRIKPFNWVISISFRVSWLNLVCLLTLWLL